MKRNIGCFPVCLSTLCLGVLCLGTHLHSPTAFAQVNGLDGYADRVVISDTGDGTARWAVDASTATGFGDGAEDAAVLFGVVSDIHLLGDVNGDGLTDKVLVRDDGFGTWQWLADYSTPTAFGDGVPDGFSLFGSFAVHTPVGMGDLNGDGESDRFLVEVAPTFLIWIADHGVAGGFGDGTGDVFSSYGAPAHTPLGFADVNNDGLTDRVINVNGPVDPPSWAADFSTGTPPNGLMGDGSPDTQEGFGGPGESNLLLGDMNNDGFVDRVVVQTGGVLTEPNWVADFTFAPLGFFGDGNGDIFQTATFGTLTDEFLLADIIDIDGTAPALPGDYNGNGTVDAADYTVWRDNLGSTTALPNDGGLGTPIGQSHFDLWKNSFGSSLGTGIGSGAPVPEPCTLVLVLALAMAGMAPIRFQRS